MAMRKYFRWPIQFNRKNLVPTEDKDLYLLNLFQSKANSLKGNNAIKNRDYLNDAGVRLQSIISEHYEISSNSQDPATLFLKVEKFLVEICTKMEMCTENFDIVNYDEKNYFESYLKIKLTATYSNRLNCAIKENELHSSVIREKSIKRLFDSLLRGNASERISEHMKLYAIDGSFNIDRFQECLYALYDPEVETCKSSALLLKGLHKHHLKGIPKVSRIFLLDVFDLNTKCRCVMAWTDPKYSGFQPIATDTKVELWKAIKGLRDFVPEYNAVGAAFANEIIIRRRQYYNQKSEDNVTLRNGFLFFVATCILDWIICIL